MDVLDYTDMREQTLLDAAIQNIRKRASHPVNDTGLCLSCGSPVPDQRRWCDADCRDAYEMGEKDN